MTPPPGARLKLVRPTTAIWRSAGVLQVGIDPPTLLLEGVPAAVADAVGVLAHPCTHQELGLLLPHLEQRWLAWLVDRLIDAGMVAAAPAEPDPSLVVLGGGALAEAVATSVADAGLRVTRFDPAGPTALPPRPDEPELVLLAPSAAEPDRALTDTLLREGRPHLVVRIEPDRAVVGPLVLPGQTPCVRCQDLTRVRMDPGWPHLLAQLCRGRVEPQPGLLAWAGATAAVQVRAWLAGSLPDTCGGALELTAPDYRLSSRTWPAHPGCGCLLPPS